MTLLSDCIYKPAKGALLYHYCTAETLVSIAKDKKIRFSDANMMNDYHEGIYAYRLFEESATGLLKDKKVQKKYPGMDKNFFDAVDQYFGRSQSILHPVIACFSKSPDVLSQWRGYADQATGFSIGFSAELINQMAATVLEVEYNRHKQLKIFKNALIEIYNAEVKRGEKWGAEFAQDCVVLSARSYAFKSSAFSEENEVRLIHLLDVEMSDDKWMLVDEEGVEDGKLVKGQPVHFRISNGSIVAYVDLPIPSAGGQQPFSEVWLGPRNKNGSGNVRYLLGNNNIGNIKLHRSLATYR